MTYKTLKDMDFSGKRVLVRVNFNVPLKNGSVSDDKRIRESLPTLLYLKEQGAKQLVLVSYLGRPAGKPDPKFTLKPAAERLAELLHQPVTFLPDCIDIAVPPHPIVLLENTRFHPEEEKNDKEFARKLADHADIYVNDAFGDSHRPYASLVAVTCFLPSCAGFLMEKEIKALSGLLKNPEKPYIAIMGGAKISDKIKVIESLLPKVDKLLLGGAMIFTFYKAKGYEIGTSLAEDDRVELARKLLTSSKIVLPSDVVISKDNTGQGICEVVPADQIKPGWAGLDIGPLTLEAYKAELAVAKTVVWNGPMGLFEVDKFAKGTNELALYLSNLQATVVIGGGDSAAAIARLGLEKKVTHVSTGGGASIEFLEGNELPGIAALDSH